MKKALVYVEGKFAGELYEIEKEKHYRFDYVENYQGSPVSLTMPIQKRSYTYEKFPPFFEGVLPEGSRLESLLRQSKIDRNDLLSQLITVGKDLVGYVTVEPEL